MYNTINFAGFAELSRLVRSKTTVVSVTSECPLHEFIAVVIIQRQQLANWKFL
jgi:hypothetical protein